MRKLKLTLLLLLCCTSLWAQQKTISIDTINLRGYVFDTNGNRINFISVQSTHPNPDNPGSKLSIYTTERGYFDLKGAALNDTLTVGPDPRFESIPFYNEGSRNVTITLVPKTNDVTGSSPLVVTHARTYPKKPTTITFTVKSAQKESPLEVSAAKYPGDLNEFIKQNLKYPESALKNNLEGTVKLGFTVTKEGFLRNLRVINSLSDDCDAEAMRVLKKSPDWVSAVSGGQPVATSQTLSVQFKLTDN